MICGYRVSIDGYLNPGSSEYKTTENGERIWHLYILLKTMKVYAR